MHRHTVSKQLTLRLLGDGSFSRATDLKFGQSLPFIRHRPNYFFHARDIHHHDRHPRGQPSRKAARPAAFSHAFLCTRCNGPGHLMRPNADVLIRHPKHAICDGAISTCGGETRHRAAPGGSQQVLSFFLRVFFVVTIPLDAGSCFTARGPPATRVRFRTRHHGRIIASLPGFVTTA